MDGSRRAFSHTFLTEFALVKVNVGKIILYGDRSKRTNLCALATTDAGCLACLACHCSFVLVNAAYEYSHIPLSLVAKFNHSLRASLDASSAGSTFLLVNDRKTGLGIHRDRIEFTCRHTVSAAETAE